MVRITTEDTNTRDKIIAAAIEIFNENGATNVSTVQIANKMGISTGNLYYYFKNKEHLIRSIWEEQIAPKVADLFYQEEFKLSENGILTFLIRFSKYTYKYRFFYSEISAIMSNDPQLKQAYTLRAKELMAHTGLVMDTWVTVGIMKEMTPVEKTFLIENCWTLAQVWNTYMKVLREEEYGKQPSYDGVLHLYAMLKPNFTDEANKRILNLIKLSECGKLHADYIRDLMPE